MKKMIRIFSILTIIFMAFLAYGCEKELKISIESHEITMNLGDELKVDILSEIVGEVTWETEDETVVTVENGLITAVGKGTTRVTVKCGNLKTQITVTVVSNGGNGNGNGDDDKIYYKLTLPSSITSDQTDNTKILKDTEVTITITVPENHIIKTLIIYGIDYMEDVVDNQLKFKMTADLEITITFEEIVVEPVYYEYTIPLPSTHLLADATPEDIKVVDGAPDLMIIGVLLDSYYYYNYETMSGYEYFKVFNNTEEPYNLKNHRITLSIPTQGRNYEDEECRAGNIAFVTGTLYSSFIDEDFIIAPLSIGLIWMKPYYWIAGSGSEGFSKPYTADILHGRGDKPGAMEQTIADFRAFWHLDDTIPVYESCNQPFIGAHTNYKINDQHPLYPILTPAAGTPYSHLNTGLLRSIEITKFDNQGGTATAELINKYSALPEAKKTNPDPIYGKIAFNALRVRDNNEDVDLYMNYPNIRKYFKPVVRATFAGLIDPTTLSQSQLDGLDKVDFLKASGPGVGHWPNTVELQFRPPKEGEKIMQLQVPLRQYANLEKYMVAEQFAIMRYVSKNEVTYRIMNQTILFTQDPTGIPIEEIKWRAWEVESEGRMSAACPGKIKLINLTRP
ncbi:MAG: hypothetical protein ACOX5Y_00470 [Acholeplasmataceae bacterium]|mgnify:CR=1 FL=1|jgi:hypothetical protein